MFELHPVLMRDTVLIGYLPLSQVLLSKDSLYPWCILVPRREGVEEIYQLIDDDRKLLMDESCLLAEVMTNLYAPHKMNIAALGNVVPQLHLHHIARFEGDIAWPSPIWGKFEAKPYDSESLESRVSILKSTLAMMDCSFCEELP